MCKKRKILFISSWYPTHLEPNNGNFVQRHAEAVSLLHNVEVLHAIGDFNLKSNYLIESKEINGIKTVIVFYKNTNKPVVNFYRRMKAYSIGFKKVIFPDLVHANVLHNNLFFVVYLQKKFKIPFVVTEHWTALQKESHHKTSIVILKTAKFIGNQARFILPVSNNLKQSLVLLGIKTPMKLVSNVVDTEVFNFKEIVGHSKDFKFLHISSLIPRKNPDKIIKAVHRLRIEGFPVQLNIGGDGDEVALQSLIKELRAESYISVFGTLTYNQVAEKMQQSDCFVLFSDNETQGCVILESYACGKPVIATMVGGVPEFVSPEKGILIEPHDEEGLYKAMKEMIKIRTQYSPNVLREFVVDKHSQESICRQFTKIYDQVLEGN